MTDASDLISDIDPTTTSESIAPVPMIAPSRTCERTILAFSRTSTSSSRFDSAISTPGAISQKRPIRTPGPIRTLPSPIFSARVVPARSSRIV